MFCGHASQTSCPEDSPGDLVKMQSLILTGLGWSLRLCSSYELPSDVCAVDLWPTLWEPLIWQVSPVTAHCKQTKQNKTKLNLPHWPYPPKFWLTDLGCHSLGIIGVKVPWMNPACSRAENHCSSAFCWDFIVPGPPWDLSTCSAPEQFSTHLWDRDQTRADSGSPPHLVLPWAGWLDQRCSG